ncbi:Protein FAM83F [Merluccius polli]|uniref:Protein FAM83F n=1 Tax=Merluccius polli TaxID=89951 RepID=A0AA47NPA0_MERPO|nr:Protein FAM83F [Merluccius polli]
MAESQVACMDDDHVNVKVPESRPEFYYSEEQRAAVEQLLRNGDGAFKTRLREDHAKDFLSAREVARLRRSFDAYAVDGADGDRESGGDGSKSRSEEGSSTDSGVHSTYWPQMSDTEVPPLDVGWVPGNGVYKGASRVSVYTHPPKDNGPHIKQVVRKLIQESNKVVAIVMDMLTDLQILQDLLDALSRRGVAVYAVLEARGVPHFLDMCSRLQINAMQLRNLRVRTVKGAGLALSFGKLPGSLSSKYMLVDGEKVMFGSYSFTWSSSRLDRNTITVMTGHVVDFFDNDFREMYAVSEEVDLYKEFSITKPPMPTPVRKPVEKLKVSNSRFQVSVKERSQTNLKVPAHKYHNPKYSLVVGNNLSRTVSLQELSTQKDPAANRLTQQNGFLTKLHNAVGDSVEKVNGVSPPQHASPAPKPPGDGEEGDGKAVSKKPSPPNGKKTRNSFRVFLKGRGTNHTSEVIEEGVVTPPNASPAPRSPGASTSAAASETEDSFDPVERPPLVKFKNKKPSKLPQRSLSLQTINTAEDDGYKGRKRHQKKNCIQS